MEAGLLRAQRQRAWRDRKANELLRELLEIKTAADTEQMRDWNMRAQTFLVFEAARQCCESEATE